MRHFVGDVCGLRNNHILYFTSPFINNEIDLNSLTLELIIKEIKEMKERENECVKHIYRLGSF